MGRKNILKAFYAAKRIRYFDIVKWMDPNEKVIITVTIDDTKPFDYNY